MVAFIIMAGHLDMDCEYYSALINVSANKCAP